MAYQERENGFSATGREAELFHGMVVTVQTEPIWVIPIKIGIFKDVWLAEFGTELPERLDRMLKAGLKQRINTNRG